jgi:hypothetical protein
MAEEAKEGSVLHRVADQAERFLEDGPVWIGVFAAIGLLLLQVPWLDDLIAKTGLENSQQLRTGVSVVLLTGILLELRQVKRSVTPAITGEHYADPHDMYTALTEKARAISDPAQRSLDVLGLTLYSAWPVLSFLLQRPDVNGWTVRLATLSKDANALSLRIPGDWPQESATTVRQVKAFEASQGAIHNHEITVYEYEFSPAVHGFRLGNGDIFISTLLWEDDNCLGKTGFAYDYVPWHDTSSWAASNRELFNNWFDRTLRSSSKEPPAVTESSA